MDKGINRWIEREGGGGEREGELNLDNA